MVQQSRKMAVYSALSIRVLLLLTENKRTRVLIILLTDSSVQAEFNSLKKSAILAEIQTHLASNSKIASLTLARTSIVYGKQTVTPLHLQSNSSTKPKITDREV